MWAAHLDGELVAFPNARNDDQVDALSQGLYRLLHGGVGGANIMAYYEQEARRLRAAAGLPQPDEGTTVEQQVGLDPYSKKRPS